MILLIPVSSGNIRNTEKLSYDKQHQYEILVTAYDCGQKPAAQDTLVQVDVKPVCKPGWQGGCCFHQNCHMKVAGNGIEKVLSFVLKSLQKTTTGIVKYSYSATKQRRLFILTTLTRGIIPISQLTTSEATRLK